MNSKTIVLHLMRSLGVFAFFRWWTRGMPRILCYHGGSVGDEHLFNPKLFCPPGMIESRLRWLEAKGFVPANLDDLIEPRLNQFQQGTPVIITLDDGWYSSATDLLPVLARHGHRPTLYLATKVFVAGVPVIDVCLRYMLWKSSLERVTFSGMGSALQGTYQLGLAADRERLCMAAEHWLASLAHDPQSSHHALERLASALGISSDTLNLASRRFSYMGVADLHEAAARGCHVELHGHAHLYVNGRPEQNRVDIETCRQHIRSLGLPMPRHYCYPSGAYDAEAAGLLASANVLTATTCEPGLVRSLNGPKRFYLPRFLDGGDVTSVEFEAEMSGVLEWLRRVTRSN